MPETEITRIDPTTYQYLKSKLSSEIGADVKASLFRQYWGWLAGFTAGVALLGYISIAKLIPEMVQATAERFIRNELALPITNAKGQIKEFDTLVSDSRQRFEKSFGATEIRSEELNRSLANIKRYSEDAARELLVVQSRIADNKKSVDEVRADFIASIKKDLVTVPDFVAASNRIAETVNELLRLKTEVAEIQQRLSISSGNTAQDSARVESLKKIVETTEARQSQSLPTRSATVFIQFAVFSREIIKTVAGGLRDLGWTVPPEERVETAINQRAIRYYYEEDAPKAKQLIADLSDQIKQAGYAPAELVPQPLLNFPKKPKPGTLEVWLGIAPSRSPP